MPKKTVYLGGGLPSPCTVNITFTPLSADTVILPIAGLCGLWGFFGSEQPAGRRPEEQRRHVGEFLWVLRGPYIVVRDKRLMAGHSFWMLAEICVWKFSTSIHEKNEGNLRLPANTPLPSRSGGTGGTFPKLRVAIWELLALQTPATKNIFTTFQTTEKNIFFGKNSLGTSNLKIYSWWSFVGHLDVPYLPIFLRAPSKKPWVVVYFLLCDTQWLTLSRLVHVGGCMSWKWSWKKLNPRWTKKIT